MMVVRYIKTGLYLVLAILVRDMYADIFVGEGAEQKMWYAKGHGDPIASALPIDDDILPRDVYSLPTKLLCSMKANQHRALMYYYEYGNCTVVGEGEHESSVEGQLTKYHPRFPQVDQLENVAPGKAVFSSPEYPERLKEYVIDDDDVTYYGPINTVKPWWLVDLGEERDIYQIHVLPRREHLPERVYDLEVRIGSTLRTDGNLSSYTLVHYYPGPYTVAEGRFICSLLDSGITGRFVSLQIVDDYDSHMQISDLKVFARKK